MKYTKTIFNILLVLFFAITWLHLNKNYFPKLEAMAMNGITYLISSGSGYHSILSHASIYAFLFLVYLLLFVSKINIQFLVRKKRTSYLLHLYTKIFIAAIQFSTIYIGVMMICTVYCVEYQFLIASNFWIAMLITFIMLVLYYLFIGAIFSLIQTCISNRSSATIFTFFVSLFLFYMAMKKKFWTPISSFTFIDPLLENSVYEDTISLSIAKICILIAIVFYVNYIIFKEKDLVNETL